MAPPTGTGDAAAAPNPTPPTPTAPAAASTSPSSSSSQTPPATQAAAVPADLPPVVKNDPARTGFDPRTAWWVNYFHILTGRVNAEGAFHYREWRARENAEADCRRCEQFRDWSLAYSPTVRFLRDRVADLNGDLGPHNVVCARCPARLTEDGAVHRQSGGFSPGHGILLCANELRDRSHLEDTLSHEMVHAWDHLRWRVDWAGDRGLRHAACTEIRASMLSGECRWSRESMTRGNWTLTQQFQDCVRRRATESVLARPRCRDRDQAAQAVNQVWDSCFSDTRPFDEVYR